MLMGELRLDIEASRGHQFDFWFADEKAFQGAAYRSSLDVSCLQPVFFFLPAVTPLR